MSHTKRFLLVFGAILLFGLVGSLIVRQIWFTTDDRESLAIGVVAPLSGGDAGLGEAALRGITLYLEEFNRSGRLGERRVVVNTIDEAAADAYAQLTDRFEAQPVAGVIGHWQRALLEQSRDYYAPLQLPVIKLGATDQQQIGSAQWLYSGLVDSGRQARFIANYTRNIVGEKLVTLIHDDSWQGETFAGDFTATYARFGTKIHYTLPFTRADAEPEIAALIAQIRDKKDLGVVVIAADVERSAQLLVALRDAGINNPVVGSDVMDSSAFRQRITTLAGERGASHYLDRILMATPLLFDTAGEQTQQFRNRYLERYGEFPDWIAAYAYDAARLLLDGIVADNSSGQRPQAENRTAILTQLQQLKREADSVTGATGAIWFDGQGVAKRTIQVGRYDGAATVAALTQLQPIPEGSRTNYFEELKAGRMLYVNDRFMFKTNVVYTGIELYAVREIDRENDTATLEFVLWFRFQGDFDPLNIEFLNMIGKPELIEPPKRQQRGDMTLITYRARGVFSYDFLNSGRAYGNHILGLSFVHKAQNRNNILYVVDLLGMGFDNPAKTLKSQLAANKALPTRFGWKVDDAWIAQDMMRLSTFGDPNYVGYGSVNPDFSRIDIGIRISPDGFNFRDLISPEYFLYIAIFGMVGSLFAIGIDATAHRSTLGFTVSWPLRVIFWPISLLAVGNLILDNAIAWGLAEHYIDMLQMGYQMFWWFVPARLLALALEHFVWRPLERRTERKIPNVIRLFSSGLLYLFALLGVIAFVLDQHLTSLLATGGLFAMIVGLAVQSNIANIFSGVVVNIERPFLVGDWIKIGSMDDGEVIDITWRTLRMKTANGRIISVPNAMASESIVINYSRSNARIDYLIHLSTEHDPQHISDLLNQTLAEVEGINELEPASAIFLQVVPVYSELASEFLIRFWVKDYANALGLKVKMWHAVWQAFAKHQIPISIRDSSMTLPTDGGESGRRAAQKLVDDNEQRPASRWEEQKHEEQRQRDDERIEDVVLQHG